MYEVNLGKWILRFLFDKLIQEERKRDTGFRESLMGHTSRTNSLRRENAPLSIPIPTIESPSISDATIDNDDSILTPRAPTKAVGKEASTPGLNIGLATPHSNGTKFNNANNPSARAGEDSDSDHRASDPTQSRSSVDRKRDYFSSDTQNEGNVDDKVNEPGTPGASSSEGNTAVPTQLTLENKEDEKLKESGTLFGKSFRMKFPKKIGRASTDVKPVAPDEKSEESDRSEEKEDRTIQDNFWGVIQRIRRGYEERVQQGLTRDILCTVTPSPLSETPALHLPPNTVVIIQDERLDSGGVADLYRGTISSVGYDANQIEKVAPVWLGELLLKVPPYSYRAIIWTSVRLTVLQNKLPDKEIPKVSFVLLPYQDLLPSIAGPDG